MNFEEIWALLAPQGEYKRRRGCSERLWQGYEPARQEEIYKNIAGKLQRGEFVNPNPYFAIEDNAAQKRPQTEPTDWNGRALVPTEHYATAFYNGKWGMYTLKDIELFHLKVKN